MISSWGKPRVCGAEISLRIEKAGLAPAEDCPFCPYGRRCSVRINEYASISIPLPSTCAHSDKLMQVETCPELY